ncbi:MAG: bifunctional riboflavin kinase/FAD synthetase [Bdellovibrio sp.]
MLLSDLSELTESVALTIGNFDGVHLGHHFLLEQVKKITNGNIPIAVMTFDPHPQLVLKSKTAFLVEDPGKKFELLHSAGVKYVVEVKFTRDFSTLSPKDFINEYILKSGKVKKIFLGHDFNFGSNKQGGIEDFIEVFQGKNVEIEKLKPLIHEGTIVSSSVIRDCINSGNVEKARIYLGRAFSLIGPVIKGAGRGKIIGFPTANIDYSKDRTLPKLGVYSTLTKYKGLTYKSVTNVGKNPTFGGDNINIETNILDFDNDIYGERIEILFLKRIRDEVKFSNTNELVDQIKKDISTRKGFND